MVMDRDVATGFAKVVSLSYRTFAKLVCVVYGSTVTVLIAVYTMVRMF